MQPWIGIVLIAMIAFGAMSSGRIINKISSLIPSMGQASVEGGIDAAANIDGVNNPAADVMGVFDASLLLDDDEIDVEATLYKVNDPDGYSNLRDAQMNVIRRVLDTETFEVINSAGEWMEIKLNDGTTGYIHSSRVVYV